MEKTKILYRVQLISEKHKRTGNTSHSRNGQLIIELPSFLQIESNPWVEDEFYLIHYDSEGNELSDTLHDGVEDAMEQAAFEFSVERSEWIMQE
jgi:hypothetical protein